MTRYVLADLREVGDELARRAAELTDWLDSTAAQYQAPNQPTPDLAMGDLACLRAVSAAAARLTAAATAVTACAGDVCAKDSEIRQRLAGWSG